MKTLIISSSLSESSRSFILCNYVFDVLKEKGVEVELVDARKLNLKPYHIGPTKDMINLAEKVEEADNIILGMALHCYSVNDSLKIILDGCFSGAKGKFFGILCAAGGDRSYLSTMHLTQICMNEWRMMQLPRIVYAIGKDFDGDKVVSEEVIERIDLFCGEFKDVGEKLLG